MEEHACHRPISGFALEAEQAGRIRGLGGGAPRTLAWEPHRRAVRFRGQPGRSHGTVIPKHCPNVDSGHLRLDQDRGWADLRATDDTRDRGASRCPNGQFRATGIAIARAHGASSLAMTATAMGVHQVATTRMGTWARTPFATSTRANPSPRERILELQRTAGNRAVASMLVQRQPTKLPRQLPVPDPFDFGSTPPPFEGGVSSDPYDRQPEALRAVVDESAKSMPLPKSVEKPSEAEKYKGDLWWSQLDRQQQQAVVAVYNRMQTLGLWKFAHRIIRVTPAECPVLKKLKVAGVTPSVVFAAKGDGLTGALISNSRMCYDAGLGGSLHAAQMSNREISEGDSLHVSVGRSDDPELGADGDFDAHIDKYASPKGKRGVACEYDPARTMAHLGREVLPGMVHRGKIGPIPVPPIGGFELVPEDTSKSGVRPEMFNDIERDEDKPPMAAGITYRFGR